MKQRAAFDCDGVILNADEIFRDNFRCQGFSVKDSNEFRYKLDPEVSDREMFIMIEDAIQRRTVDMDGYEGIKEAMSRMFCNTGEPISIVTARNPNSASQTVQAIKRVVGTTPFSISFADGIPKSTFLGSFKVFVDDCRETAMNLASEGKTVLVPKRSYNFPIDLPRFSPETGRSWTWMEECEVGHYGVGYKDYPPDLFWCGRIIFMDSVESLIKNEKIFRLLLGP
jgi:hypothetical protein